MAAYQLFADLAAVVVRQRCREQNCAGGRRGTPRTSIGLPVALAPEDGQLLEVFHSIARLNSAIRSNCR